MQESKSKYFRQMEEFCEAGANKCRERDLHTHMRETELKEKEEVLK
jgi:hypothetical protein